MKKILIVVLAFLFLSKLQAQGIAFEEDLAWEQVKEKAKKENKFIFLDFFATWCGPCKQMDRSVFNRPEVGAYFNERFVSVKVQMDTAKSDNEQTKKWYATARQLGGWFNIAAYPTYIFLSPEGVPVHRVVKGAIPASDFLQVGRSAVDTQRQLFTQLRQYERGRRDAPFIKNLSSVMAEAGDYALAATLAKDYINNIPEAELFTKQNLQFIEAHTDSSNKRGFSLFLKYADKVNEVLGKNRAENLVRRVVRKEFIDPNVFGGPTPDWQKLEAAVRKKYEGNVLALEALYGVQMSACQQLHNWKGFATAYEHYYSTALQRNEYSIEVLSRVILEHIDDPKLVAFAEEVVAYEMQNVSDDPLLLDVYAALLYKQGKKNEALEWQAKAIALDPESELLKENLAKMKKGEKTWVIN